MKNIDYDSILSGFQRKRLENEILADNQKAEIYEKIPEIKKNQSGNGFYYFVLTNYSASITP